MFDQIDIIQQEVNQFSSKELSEIEEYYLKAYNRIAIVRPNKPILENHRNLFHVAMMLRDKSKKFDTSYGGQKKIKTL